MRKARALVALVFLLFVLHFAPCAAQQNKSTISTPEQIKDEFKTVACKNNERQSAVKSLFESMGASASDISVEKFKNVENVVIRKRGASDEKIVVGAHYDKVAEGCGAIDNWTGVVAVAHLYRTLKDVPLNKTVIFVAFGREEDGLIGSKAMVEAITKEEKKQYCAMINIDSLGLGAPQITDDNTSHKLRLLAEDIAKRMGIPFGHASIVGADSDAGSFYRKGIPSMDINGLTSRWRSYLHTSSDKTANVNAESVYLGYRLALAALISIDRAPCDSFR